MPFYLQLILSLCSYHDFTQTIYRGGGHAYEIIAIMLHE